MRKIIFGVVAGLLLGAGVVLAQDGAWRGQQWEYAVLTWNQQTGEVFPAPVVSYAVADVQAATSDLLQGIYTDYLIANDLTELPENGLYAYVLRGMGLDGWELVTSQVVTNFQTVQVFKRPRP